MIAPSEMKIRIDINMPGCVAPSAADNLPDAPKTACAIWEHGILVI
jgi:hypothetical protein